MDKSHNLITSVAFCFIVLLVGTMSREVKAQDTNSPSTNSPNAAQNKSVTPSGVVLLDKKVGFPIVINQPGSFSLKSNLTVPANTNGIVIQADNVTIDLNGFSIIGNGSGDGITDNRVGHTNITIRNGTITNFNNGINLSNSSQSDVEQIRVNNNGNWGILVGGTSIVSRNIASNNGLSPTSPNFGGIGTGSSSTISGNIASGNNGDGIAASGIACLISGNTANLNSQFGISTGVFSTVSGNTTSENNTGISIGASSTISGNTASSNQNIGIGTSCPSNIVGNTAQLNTNGDIVETFQGCTRANNLPAP